MKGQLTESNHMANDNLRLKDPKEGAVLVPSGPEKFKIRMLRSEIWPTTHAPRALLSDDDVRQKDLPRKSYTPIRELEL